MRMLLAGLFILTALPSCSWFDAAGETVEATGEAAGHAVSSTGRAISGAAHETERELED